MPDKPDEEIRKSIKRFEESLPESERNPDAQRSALAAIVREDIEAIPFQDGQCNSFFEESAARIVERTMPPKGIPFGL